MVHTGAIVGVQPTQGELRIDLGGDWYQSSIDAECSEFVERIRTGKASPIDAQEGRKDLEIVEAAYRSAKTGQAVRLPLRS